MTPIPSGNWVTLGTGDGRTVVLDHDTIVVGASSGTFRTLRFHVTQRSIFLNDVRVTFGNGETQVYNFNQHVNAGAWSVPLDLRGRRSDHLPDRHRLPQGFELAGQCPPERPGPQLSLAVSDPRV